MTTTQRYANRQALADGTITHHVLLEADGHFLFTTTRLGELITSKPVGPVQGGLIDALRSEPALLSVGTGLTCITTDGTIDLHELLGLLVVEQPDAEEPNPDDWVDQDGKPTVDLGMSLEDVAFASDQIHEMRTNPGYETVGRWLYINGERGFVLRGPNFIGVGIADADHEWAVPSTTRDMLEWGFYGESGGPCTFDGGAELAWCGPDIWVFHRWGDWDPNLLVFRAPEPERLVREVAGSIEHLGWTREYLLSAVGLPGLTDEDREALGDVLDTFFANARDRIGQDVINEAHATLRYFDRLEQRLAPLLAGMSFRTYGALKSACVGARTQIGNVLDQKALAGEL